MGNWDVSVDTNDKMPTPALKVPHNPHQHNVGNHLHYQAMATETKPPHQNDILVESNSYETIPERQYKILQVYRSVIQSEDPDWKIQLAKDMVGSLGFSPKIANDCFILHGDDLYFKEESETAWRIVKPGTISTISQEILDADDSSLSMIVPESNKEYDINEMDIEKENDVFPVGPISFPPMFVANDDNDSVPILSPPKVNCAIMSDTTNEGILCGTFH